MINHGCIRQKEAVYECIRTHVPTIDEDRIFYKDYITSSLKGMKETDIKNIFN